MSINMNSYKFYDSIKRMIDCDIPNQHAEAIASEINRIYENQLSHNDLEELHLKIALKLQKIKTELYKWFISIILAQTATIIAVVGFLHGH